MVLKRLLHWAVLLANAVTKFGKPALFSLSILNQSLFPPMSKIRKLQVESFRVAFVNMSLDISDENPSELNESHVWHVLLVALSGLTLEEESVWGLT